MICIANKARRTLIVLGKVLPFFICTIVCISYIECIFAILFNNFVSYKNYIVANKPVSTTIAEYFEYDFVVVVICLIISISVETCKWNRRAILYLALHLIFKSYIEDIELYTDTIIIICTINIIIASYLVFKGVKIMLKH